MSTVHLALAAPADLEVRRLEVREALSSPFELNLVCASRDGGLDLDVFIGRSAKVSVDRGALGSRLWAGSCASFEALPGEGALHFYAVRVVSALALLAHRRDHTVFENKSAPEIAEAVFTRAGVEVERRLVREHAPVALRVQRGETDLHFVERVLEDAGIGYVCETHDAKGDGKPRVLLVDAPERVEPRAGALPVIAQPDPASPTPFATAVRARIDVRPSAVATSGFDFLRPRFSPTYRARAGSAGEARLELSAFEGLPGTDREGDARVEDRLAAVRAERSVVELTTNLIALAPGDALDLARSGRGDDRLVVLRARVVWREEAPLETHVVAVRPNAPIRPARRAPRPRAPGVETAFVVGPPGEELHVDEHGRVRIRFAWDTAEDRRFDDAPWVRVDTGWAGTGFGAAMLPRIGDEVLVGYLHGDHEAPVVVGRLFNASRPAPFAAEEGATAIRTQVPGSDAFHEIALGDQKGAELVRLRSAKDLSKAVQHDEREHVMKDSHALVATSRSVTVGALETIEVGQVHEVRMAEVKRVGTELDASALATRREIVAKRITITTGGATLTLDGPDIVLAGEKGVRIEAKGTVSIQGEPYVHLNPPIPTAAVDAATAPPALSHLVWFRLLSEGRPLAGVRVHLSKQGGGAEAESFHETDGNGAIRVPVDGEGSFAAKVAHGSTHVPEGVHVAHVDAQEAAHAKASDHEVPITIEVKEPLPHHVYHLTNDAEMPKLPLDARVIVAGKPFTEGRVGWTFRVEGDYRVRSSDGRSFREQPYRLRAGHAETTPNEVKHYRLMPGEVVGGDLHVDIHFDGGPALGGLKATKRVSGIQVLGKNPPRDEVFRFIAEKGGRLAWVYLRLFCWESGHRLAQFAEKSGGGNTPGEPLYGPPSGIGIVQRDPEAGEWRFGHPAATHPNHFFPRIFWDWKKNVEEGIASFEETYVARGRADLELLRREHPHLPPWSDGVLYRAAIRRYNGGTEYAASGDGRHYVVRPVSSNPAYVSDVLGDPHVDAHKYPVPHDARELEWP